MAKPDVLPGDMPSPGSTLADQPEEYAERIGDYVFIDAQSPIMGLDGITYPVNTQGEYYRLDASGKVIYPDDIRLLAEEVAHFRA